MLIESPGASGVASDTASADTDELKPPPLFCVGGCSRVVPKTVTSQGVTPSGQVLESLMPFTVKSVEVRSRRSAIPEGAEKVEISTTRNRRRVTGNPVAL